VGKHIFYAREYLGMSSFCCKKFLEVFLCVTMVIPAGGLLFLFCCSAAAAMATVCAVATNAATIAAAAAK